MVPFHNNLASYRERLDNLSTRMEAREKIEGGLDDLTAMRVEITTLRTDIYQVGPHIFLCFVVRSPYLMCPSV